MRIAPGAIPTFRILILTSFPVFCIFAQNEVRFVQNYSSPLLKLQLFHFQITVFFILAPYPFTKVLFSILSLIINKGLPLV
jgi:hypothetical protein